MQNQQYNELIDTYTQAVLCAFRQCRDSLLHQNPHKVLQTTVELERQVRNAGGLIDCLKREGYNNAVFYSRIDQVANKLVETAMATPCWGLPREFIGRLEREIVSLCEDGTHEHRSTDYRRTG